MKILFVHVRGYDDRGSYTYGGGCGCCCKKGNLLPMLAALAAAVFFIQQILMMGGRRKRRRKRQIYSDEFISDMSHRQNCKICLEFDIIYFQLKLNSKISSSPQ